MRREIISIGQGWGTFEGDIMLTPSNRPQNHCAIKMRLARCSFAVNQSLADTMVGCADHACGSVAERDRSGC